MTTLLHLDTSHAIAKVWKGFENLYKIVNNWAPDKDPLFFFPPNPRNGYEKKVRAQGSQTDDEALSDGEQHEHGCAIHNLKIRVAKLEMEKEELKESLKSTQAEVEDLKEQASAIAAKLTITTGRSGNLMGHLAYSEPLLPLRSCSWHRPLFRTNACANHFT